MMRQFRYELEKINRTKDTLENSILDKIAQWPESLLKSIIKIQWYTALNAGSCFDPTESIKKNKNKLNIHEDEQKLYTEPIKKIFNGMPILKRLKDLQVVLSKQKMIYLPTDPEPFDGTTESKSEIAKRKKGGAWEH